MTLMMAPTTASATTPPAGFVLVETIPVPRFGAVRTSTAVLQSGVTYKLRASGTITVADGSPCPFADAEFERFDASGSDSCGIFGDLAFDGTDTGIGVNDSVLDGAKFPKWGAYTTSHEYTIDFVGLGAPITVMYHDCPGCTGDNTGPNTLQLEIFAPGQPVPTLTQWAQILMAALLVGGGLWALGRRPRPARPAA
jgi:hypothetical protein